MKFREDKLGFSRSLYSAIDHFFKSFKDARKQRNEANTPTVCFKKENE